MKLEWAPRALRDLRQLRAYIAADSPFYARQFTERMLMAIERLTDFPNMGRKVPEAAYQDHIREIIYQGYRIIYRIKNEKLVQVIAILHGTQNLADMQPPWKD